MQTHAACSFFFSVGEHKLQRSQGYTHAQKVAFLRSLQGDKVNARQQSKANRIRITVRVSGGRHRPTWFEYHAQERKKNVSLTKPASQPCIRLSRLLSLSQWRPRSLSRSSEKRDPCLPVFTIPREFGRQTYI